MYYTPWKLVNGGITASGLSWNGVSKDGSNRWDRIYAVNITGIEYESTCVKMMGQWNHSVHVWLKHYVQERMAGLNGKVTLLVTCGTFMTSAFWHGFYPFYYFMFFNCGMMVELSKEIYRSRVFFEWVPYPGFVAYFLSYLCLNYLGTAFNLLTFERGGIFGRATGYYIFIMIPLCLTIFKVFGISEKAKKVMAESDDMSS